MSAQNLDDLVGEMVEFGIPIESAVLIGPALLPVLNDARGLKVAIEEDAPLIALKLGILKIQ